MKGGHIALGLATLLAVPVIAMAAEFRVGEQPSTGAAERIVDDVYLVGGSISSAGNVTGDLIVGGGNVIISGPVGADLLAGGGNVSILSAVGDDVRAGGGNVIIQGKVSGDVVAGGGQISLSGPGVGGDVAVAGGDVRIDAPIAGDLRIGGGSVYINAPVAGTIVIEADTVTLGSKAVISGDITYRASKELTKEAGALVNGKVNFTQRESREISAGLLAGLLSFFVISKFIMTLASALVFGLIFKRYSNTLVRTVVANPLLELGRGFGALILLPVASVILLFTVIGMPLGALGLLTFIATLIFSYVLTPIVIGSLVHGGFDRTKMFDVTWVSILTGTVVYTLLSFIPFVGWLANSVLCLMTIGAMAKIKWDVIKEWR